MAFVKGVMASSVLDFAATGGNVTNSGGYTIHTFTGGGTFTTLGGTKTLVKPSIKSIV